MREETQPDCITYLGLILHLNGTLWGEGQDPLRCKAPWEKVALCFPTHPENILHERAMSELLIGCYILQQACTGVSIPST